MRQRLSLTLLLLVGMAVAQSPSVPSGRVMETTKKMLPPPRTGPTLTDPGTLQPQRTFQRLPIRGLKRDPFVSPIVTGTGAARSTCTTGKRCLVPDQVILRGVVRASGGMIAVVTNASNKAYFLRENDPIFNGHVLRITGDSVIFRENVTDRLGRISTRDVTKRVNAPAV
jgi:hypothetical protein